MSKTKPKEKYVRNRKDGTYSPYDEKTGKIMVGLVLTFLPENGEYVGEYDY
jgi:hypothetical protein